MEVWYVSAYDQPKGQSPRTWDFCVELCRRGHSVTMFTNSFCHFTRHERLGPKEKWRVETIDGIRVVWLKTRAYVGNGLGRGLNMLDNARGVIRSSRSLPGKPDVVLGPSVPLLTGLAAERIAYRFGVPFVFEVRDVWPDALVDMGGLSKTSPVYLAFRYIEKFLYRKAARISSTLPYLFNHVANSGGDPGKIIVIPNGIDLSKYDNNEQYDGGSNDRLTVMYVGGFGLDHDVPSIIEAARILQERGDRRFNFILMGDGVRKFECEVLAERYRLSNLAIKAPVPKSSLPIVQREADVFIAAITDSLSYRFGLNLNKLCSYFASGRPVLFAGNPPNNPVMEAGAGICVPAHDPDAIVSGLNKMAAVSSDGRLRMASYGRDYAKNIIAMPALGDRMEAMLSRVVCEASSQSRRAK